MMGPKVPPGHVRAIVERPYDEALAAAATELVNGRDPSRSVARYIASRKLPDGLEIDASFGAIPIGPGASDDEVLDLRAVYREPQSSRRFLVSGFVKEVADRVPARFVENDEEFPIYSNPLVGGLEAPPPCLPTCGSSQYVGATDEVRDKLGFGVLQSSGLDGEGVAIAIVDSGIYEPRLRWPLGEVLRPPATFYLDRGNSWRPWDLVTGPGGHRVGHGTMCAYDALIAAPKATLLDLPMLLARPVADHHSKSMVDAALLAYFHLAVLWWVKRPFDGLVVSNSWGLFHPCLEDFPPGHPNRFIDNPRHALRKYLIRPLAASGVDIVFCGNNCGNGKNCAGNCASGACLSKTDRMIMGASTYPEVLTVGGCDTDDEVVGYSSRGPSIANMFQEKPDLVAYTHFLGSKVLGRSVPDTGVSAACPVAAGCVAALRTKVSHTAVTPKRLFDTLKQTARRRGAPKGWSPDAGYGIIDPVAAGRVLGAIP
jgi:subtilisin family serine protease